MSFFMHSFLSYPHYLYIMTTNKNEKIIEAKKLSKQALWFFILSHFIFLALYIFFWGYKGLWHQLLEFAAWFLWLFIPSIVVHEGLHGLIWAIPNHWKNIRFGFNRNLMAPYTHCTIPLKKWHYWLGGMMPGILMGVIPAVYAISVGNIQILYWGIFYTWTAAGDFISCWHVLKEKNDSLILDHPDELGYVVQ